MEPTGPRLLRPGFLRSPLSPRAPDCFFQLGNLTFAEADYQQALALSPKDEGAHLRMGLLQEKLGFCEQQSRCEPMVGGAGPGAGVALPWDGRQVLVMILSMRTNFSASKLKCRPQSFL